MTGKNDELRNRKTIIKGIRVAEELAGKHPGLLSSRRKSPEVVALGGNSSSIGVPGSLSISKDNQCFGYRRVLPVIVRLALANLQHSLRDLCRLVLFLQKKRDGRRVDAGIRIRWRNLKGAIVAVESLPKAALVGRTSTPLVFVGPAKD